MHTNEMKRLRPSQKVLPTAENGIAMSTRFIWPHRHGFIRHAGLDLKGKTGLVLFDRVHEPFVIQKHSRFIRERNKIALIPQIRIKFSVECGKMPKAEGDFVEI